MMVWITCHAKLPSYDLYKSRPCLKNNYFNSSSIHKKIQKFAAEAQTFLSFSSSFFLNTDTQRFTTILIIRRPPCPRTPKHKFLHSH